MEKEQITEKSIKILTASIGNHTFGISINDIQDVIKCSPTTHVPLAPDNIVGLLNLRGHIVTEINIAKTLEIELEMKKPIEECYSIVINKNNEMYSLVFEEIGDVIDIDESKMETLPFTINKKWLTLSKGVYRLEHTLLIILDFDMLIDTIKLAA